MPHDRKGQRVEVGDLVVGRGYNITHDIVGQVLAVTECESCNVTVLTFEARRVSSSLVRDAVDNGMPVNYVTASDRNGTRYFVPKVLMEWGEASSFEVVAKAPEPALMEQANAAAQ